MAKKSGSKKGKSGASKTAELQKAMKGQAAAAKAKAKTPKVRNDEVAHELLPKGFSGHVARISGGKNIGVHKAIDGKSLCGSDVTMITPNLAAHKGFWKRTTEAVDCGRCVKSEAKAKAMPKEKKDKTAKAPATKKGAASKADSKSTHTRKAAA